MTPEQQAAIAAAQARLQGGGGMTAAQQAAIQAAQARLQAQPQSPPSMQRAGGYGPVLAGVADAGIRGFMGVKQLFGGLSEDDKAVLAEMKKEQDAETSKGLRTTGNLAANIALTAVPGNAIGRGVQGARVLQSTGRALPYLATAAAAGGVEGLTAVGQGDTVGEQLTDKAKQAATAAVLAPVLQKSVQVAAKPITGLFRARPDAERLFAQGVNPTLQQGAATPWGRFVGGLAAGSSSVRARQENEIADAVVSRATQGNVSALSGTGGDHLRAAEGYVDDLYQQLTQGKRFNISPAMRQNMATAASAINRQGQFRREADEASETLANIMGDSTTNIRVGIDRLRDDHLSPLAKAAAAARDKNNEKVAERLLAARDILKQQSLLAQLSPDEQAKHAVADTLNFDVHRIREAIGKKGEAEGITLSRLADAYGGKVNQAAKVGNTTNEELIGPALRVLGRTPTQDEARATKVTALRIGAGLGLTAGASPFVGGPATAAVAGAAAPFYAISALGQSAPGAKALLGQYEMQRRLAEALRTSQVMRALERGTAVGTTDGEE